MVPSSLLLIAADAVLAVHFGIALFVVGGLASIVIGNRRGWRWVNDRCFRCVHLIAIAIIAIQSWLGAACPLTRLEMWLRTQAGAASYSGSFVGFWLQRFLYYDAPNWLFVLVYSLFALAVIAVFWYYPPRNQHD